MSVLGEELLISRTSRGCPTRFEYSGCMALIVFYICLGNTELNMISWYEKIE